MFESLIPFLTDPTTLMGATFLCLCGTANVLVHVLPVAKEDSKGWYKMFMKTVNYIAANFGKAQNAPRV